MGDMYDFNPYEGADHNKRKFLGEPGSCNVVLGNEEEDPKFKGPCGSEYESYRNCLRVKEFSRNACWSK